MHSLNYFARSKPGKFLAATGLAVGFAFPYAAAGYIGKELYEQRSRPTDDLFDENAKKRNEDLEKIVAGTMGTMIILPFALYAGFLGASLGGLASQKLGFERRARRQAYSPYPPSRYYPSQDYARKKHLDKRIK